MKKFNLYFLVVAASIVALTSCEPDEVIREIEVPVEVPVEVEIEHETEIQRISFESIQLDATGYKNNFPDGLVLSDVGFYNYYDAVWSSWEGFSVSSKTDMVTAGYENEFSVYAMSGANRSEKFAIAYSGFYETTNFKFLGNQEFNLRSLMINNSTLVVRALEDGLFASRAFANSDWFKVVISGFDVNGVETGKVEFYLADFRDGKSFICQEWTKVDLTALGKVNKVEFAFESTDNGDWGMNTPGYACIDDIIYKLN